MNALQGSLWPKRMFWQGLHLSASTYCKMKHQRGRNEQQQKKPSRVPTEFSKGSLKVLSLDIDF